MRNLIGAIIVLVVILTINPLIATGTKDLLDKNNGAFIVSASSEYGGTWMAQYLLDKMTSNGWCSESGKPFPHTIIIELKQLSRIDEFTIDNKNAQESGYPGISARRFELYFSTTSSDRGYQLALKGEAWKEDQRHFKIDPPANARWIKLVIISNWGNPDYTEVMKIWAYGVPLQPEEAGSNPLDGATVISTSSQYDDSWSGNLLLDKTTEKGWCSAADSAFPHTIVIELKDIDRIKKFVIDNRGAQESGYPGISARRFELYASPLSKSYGHMLVLTGEAAQGARREFSLDTPVNARWLKLVILSNWGNASYTEIMELEAYAD